LKGVLRCRLQLLDVLCAAAEYDELPVRHNEDKLNASLSSNVRFPTDIRTADDPHTKANLLLQVLCHVIIILWSIFACSFR
jgi:fumarate hydratase class II